MKKIILTFLILIITTLHSNISFADQNKNIDHITKNLRCLICQGQSVYDSQSDFALSMKKLIQIKIKEGNTEDEIYKFLKEKYLNNFKIVRKKIKIVEERDRVRNFQPPITGEEIMDYFKIKPCKEIGQIKNFIKESILNGDIENSHKQAYNLMIEKGKELGL